MKLFRTLIFIFFASNSLLSQRYLTEVFTTLDSVIAGTYGNSVDYQGQTQNLLFDFYEPEFDTEQKRPFILYIHGGGFTSGTRDYPSVKSLCRTMSRKGYTVATIDYRLDPNFDIYSSASDRRAMTDAMHDAKQAIRYFKTNAALYKIDTNKFFVGGESAGAATAMMASYIHNQSEMISYPMAVPNDPVGSSANSSVGNGVNATMCLCGLLLDTNAMESSENNPLLWIHSTNDNFVPIALSFQIPLRATNVGIPVVTNVFSGPHCPWYFGNPNWSTYLDSTVAEITDFLYPILSANVGLNDKVEFTDLKIYPNPAVSKIFIESKTAIAKIEIINSQGQVVHVSKEMEVDVRNLVQGVYSMRLISDKSSQYFHRFVILR